MRFASGEARVTWKSRSSILFGIVIVLLLAASPGAIRKIVQTGDPYLFTAAFFRDILARLSGPGRLRFIIQPTVAIILGARSGIRDAQLGCPPFIWAVLFHGEHRKELLKSMLVSISDLAALAILLDLVSQFLIFHDVRPGAALIVGPALITLPYACSRALTHRLVHKNYESMTATHAK